jgi:hypothetical protein
VNYNPYAPPQAAVPQYAPAQIGTGQPQPWEIGEVINNAFEAFKANWVVLVFSPLLAGLLIMPAFVPFIILIATGSVEPLSAEYWLAYSGSYLLMLIPGSFFYAGLYKIALSAARGERPDFGLLFSGGNRFIAMLGTSYVLVFLVLLGYAFLIVPGVILALGLSMSVMYVIDQNMGPIDAMKASWSATEGHKTHLFLLGLVAMGMYLCGYIACGVGLLVVMPILMVTHAIVYLRMSGRGVPVPMYGMQPAYGGQYAPPGYPPPAPYGPPPGFGGAAQGGQGGYGGPQGGQGGFGGPQGPQGGQGGFGGPQGGQGGGFGGPQGGPGGQQGGPPGGQGGPPPGGGGGFGGGGGYGPPGGGGGGGFGGGGGGYGPPGGS